MSANTDYNNNSEYSSVTLSLDDGTEVECAVIRTFPAGDKNYIALLPIADIDEDESEVYLYRYSINQIMNLFLKTLNQMKNMRLFPMHLMRSLMPWSMKSSMHRRILKQTLH